MIPEQPVPAPETPVAATPAPMGPVLKVQLSEERRTFFLKEIERARQAREHRIAEWQVKENIKRYQPAEKGAVGVNTGVDFRDVERKAADLFFGLAEVSLVADDDEAAQEAALLHQQFINGMLSDQKMDAKATADKAVLDCLLVIQPAVTKFGYIPTTVDVPHPQTGMPTPIVIHEEMFFSRVSGQAGLIPVDFKDTDYDKSPWLGYDWKMACSAARREFKLPDGWEPPRGAERKTTFADDAATPSGDSDPQCSGTTLYYRTYLFDETVRHPDLIRELVFIDGYQEGPVKHEDLQCQRVEQRPGHPNIGRLTADSCIGFPVHLLAVRDFPDSAHVPADSSLTGPLTGEVNDYMTLAKSQKESNRLVMLVDVDKIDANAMEKIRSLDPLAKLGLSLIPVQGGALSNPDSVMKQVPTLEFGRETYLGLDRFERFRNQILGISENGGAATTQTRRTATETNAVQQNMGARFEKERKRVLKWWLKGIQNKLSPMLIRYGDRLAVEILGPAKGAKWVQYRDAEMLGSFRFKLSVDSGRYQDIEETRRQKFQALNLLAKHQRMNQDFLLEEVCDAMGWDRTKAILPPPEPRAETVKGALSFNGQDLMGPQAPMVVEALQQMGIKFSPTAVANVLARAAMIPPPTDGAGIDATNPNPPHGGAADTAERIDKHQLQESGGLQNGPGGSGAVM